MRVVPDRSHLLKLRKSMRGSVGWVPTMGALHRGHMSLVGGSLEECDATIVGIYVNPLQFGPTEDFAEYPRTLDADLEMLESVAVDAVFIPNDEAVFPDGRDAIETVLDVPRLTSGLCGAARPGHFQGMLIEVLAQLLIVQPTDIFFGEKDYQQLASIKAVLRDLSLPIRTHGLPTVREVDGLAVSSRNINLEPKHRAIAPILYRTLERLAAALEVGRPSAELLADAREELIAAGFREVEYLELVDPNSLDPLSETPAAAHGRLMAAAWLGSVRLIDNVPVSLTTT